jgi:CBS domain-containing protein
MTEKLARRGLHIHLEYEPDILQQMRVHEVMDSKPDVIPSTMTVREVADRVTRGDPAFIRHQAFPIVDKHHLVGIITRGDIFEALAGEGDEDKTVLEAGNDEPIVTYPDELIHDAVSKMLRNDIGRLPVVDRQTPHNLVGYLGRAAVMEARLHRLHEEHVLEPGWLKQISLPKQSNTSRSEGHSSIPYKDDPK